MKGASGLNPLHFVKDAGAGQHPMLCLLNGTTITKKEINPQWTDPFPGGTTC